MNLLGVHSLHALAYCERLFYLENVEMIRLADARVYAGRTLHVEIAREEEGEWHTLDLESESLGLRGRIDCLRRRDGSNIPYEHKRGRAARTRDGENASSSGSTSSSKPGAPCAWPSDRLQVAAYAMLVEEVTGQQIPEARVRYHQDNVTVRVPIDAMAREDVLNAIARARELSEMVERPPVTTNENLCVKCSLAPACLPEEARRAAALADAASETIAGDSARVSSSEPDEDSGGDELLDSQIEDDDISP